MGLTLLIPAAIAVWWMQRHTTASTLLNVYIPALLLFPLYFEYRLKGLPPIDDVQPIMLVIAIYILLRHRDELYFSSTDIWVGIFVYGVMISETFNTDLSTGIYQFFSDIGSALLPYLCGKMFIEQYGQRTAMLKRICWLLVIVAIGSTYEFRFAVNPYHQYIGPLFDNQGSDWFVQMRWGHARISGPYAHAIMAGMIFLTGVLFNVWLMRFNKWEKDFSWFKLRWAGKGAIIMFFLLMGEFMTQSRGPWMGLGFGFAVALIGFAQNTRRAFIRFIVIATLVFAAAYPFFNQYTAGTTADAQNIDQENAIYRRQLIDSYTPVVEAGGLWGWGQTKFPIVNGQASIDNEYLYLGVTRGYLGVTVFILLMADVILSLIRTGLSFHNREDRLFAFCMIGVISGVLFSITTVYLGNQIYNLLFMLFGWSQAIGRKRGGEFERPHFRRVIA
jgi:hypothetical protein